MQTFLDGLNVLIAQWPVVLGAAGIVSAGCYVVIYLYQCVSDEKLNSYLFLSILIFIFSIILRLAFITETFVPPYFDSVEHYRLIKELVAAFQSGDFWGILPGLTPGYYHLGFHFLASILAFGLRADPIDVILVFGQVTLAAIPIPIFFLIIHETKSTAAAFFGFVLAGFGWFMPGYALNWGKYPAISGFLAFELVLSLAYFFPQGKTPRSNFVLYILLLLGISISTLIHTRTLVILAISLVSWMFSKRITTLSRTNQYFSTAILVIAVLAFGFHIYSDPLLKLALEPYLDAGFWITLIVLALSPFAWNKFPRGTIFSIIFTLCVLVCLFIPLNQTLAGYPNQTLLDRPFVEMILYFPLSILGGLGLAAVLQVVGEIRTFPAKFLSETHARGGGNILGIGFKYKYAKNLIAFLFIVLTGIISLRNYAFYPSDCCTLLGYDDTIAIDWLERNSPADASILVSSTAMNLFPSGPSASIVGTDAGVWIPNLTGRQIILMPFDLNFGSKDTLEMLCEKHINYIYVGNTNQSFDAAQLQKKTDWYKMTLLLPEVQLYRLKECPSAR